MEINTHTYTKITKKYELTNADIIQLLQLKFPQDSFPYNSEVYVGEPGETGHVVIGVGDPVIVTTIIREEVE